jgi:hypothetical protein
MRVYDQLASAHSKAAIFTWCLVGWIYAAFTWHVLLLPGILIFFPGIFIASLIAAVFFIPLWFITKKVKGDLETYGGKHWQLLTLATILKIGGFISPIAGAIGYVHLLRYFLE